MNRTALNIARSFALATSLAAALTGCASIDDDGWSDSQAVRVAPPLSEREHRQPIPEYAALSDERYPIPAVDPRYVKPEFVRTVVDYRGPYDPGTIVVDPSAHYLYLVLTNGEAVRYGIGVGRDGFAWNGSAHVGRKAEWPVWTPPAEMIAREPEKLEPYRNGMPPGIDNPLGARALYLYSADGRDTLYRIHGTNEPWSIGKNMSSGCIRMLNQDVVDLYRRVAENSRVEVLASRDEVADNAWRDYVSPPMGLTRRQ